MGVERKLIETPDYVIVRTHLAGSKCFNARVTRMALEVSHARAEGECIMKPRVPFECTTALKHEAS